MHVSPILASLPTVDNLLAQFVRRMGYQTDKTMVMFRPRGDMEVLKVRVSPRHTHCVDAFSTLTSSLHCLLSPIVSACPSRRSEQHAWLCSVADQLAIDPWQMLRTAG